MRNMWDCHCSWGEVLQVGWGGPGGERGGFGDPAESLGSPREEIPMQKP